MDGLEQNWQNNFTPCEYSTRLVNKLHHLNNTTPQKVDIAAITKAIYYARKYHGDQKRQSGEPFYSHPLEVASMFAEYTAQEKVQYYKTDLIITAILHDTIEDTVLTKEIIEAIFGLQVSNNVDDLTRIKSYNKISSAEMINSLWLQKKYDILLIKHFDRIHNMQTIGAKTLEKIRKITNETLDYFLVLAMYDQHQDLEKLMYKLCCDALSIEVTSYDHLLDIMQDSHLVSLKESDTHQIVSQVFQNDLILSKNIK